MCRHQTMRDESNNASLIQYANMQIQQVFADKQIEDMLKKIRISKHRAFFFRWIHKWILVFDRSILVE